MVIEVRDRGVRPTAALRRHIESRLEFALDRLRERVVKVVVRLSDENGPRGGPDKTCWLAVLLRGGGSVRVADTDADLYAAIDRAAHRAARAVTRSVDRERTLMLELLALAELAGRSADPGKA